MSPEDRAWLAGLLEGEGCFAFYGTPRISVSMTDRDVIDRVAHLMGATLISERRDPRKPTHKTQYVTQVAGTRAHRLMRDLLPLMGARRAARIREVLDADGARAATCEWCGGPMQRQNRRARFCSQPHQLAAYRRRVKESQHGR